MEDWMQETPLGKLKIPESMKDKCPKCHSTDLQVILTDEFHCLNCGSRKKRYKCRSCGKVFGDIPF